MAELFRHRVSNPFQSTFDPKGFFDSILLFRDQSPVEEGVSGRGLNRDGNSGETVRGIDQRMTVPLIRRGSAVRTDAAQGSGRRAA